MPHFHLVEDDLRLFVPGQGLEQGGFDPRCLAIDDEQGDSFLGIGTLFRAGDAEDIVRQVGVGDKKLHAADDVPVPGGCRP